MATIKLDLSQYKSSGIYILEFDASENIVLNTQTVRLLVGFSRKGPFNAPVYLPDKKTAKLVFGEIDPFLERRGVYFHRAIYTCLEKGPVFALNLMPLNNDPDFGDKVPYQSFSLATTEKNGKKVWKLYSSFFNKERFWKADVDYFLGNVEDHPINNGKLFNVVNLGQVPMSILIKKTNVQGFNITAREFYGAGNVPKYIDEWDYISDYFVEVILIEGSTWNNYGNLSVDPVFSKYFDIRGLKKEKYKEFLSLPEINVLGPFTGCLLPDFVDGNGVNHSIDRILNNSLASTGIFIAINKEALEDYDVFANIDDEDNVSAVDVIGHNLANPTRENPDVIDFLSYKTSIKERISFLLKEDFDEDEYEANSGDDFYTESLHLGKSYGYLDNVMVFPKPLNSYGQTIKDDDPDSMKSVGNFTWYDYMTIKNTLEVGQSLIKTSNDKWGKVEQIYEEENPENGRIYLKVVYSHPDKADEKDLYGFDFTITTLGERKFIAIDRSDVPIDKISDFEDITTYPTKGQDILLENRTTNTWYYVKVAETPVEDDFDIEYGEQKESISIEVDDSDALDVFETNTDGFKAYFKSTTSVNPLDEDDVSVPIVIVAEPDKFIFVDKAGTTDPNYFISYKYNKVFKYFDDGALLPGDKYFFGLGDTAYHYLDYERSVDADGISILKIKGYDTFINNQFGYTDTGTGANIDPALNFIRGTEQVDYTKYGISIYGVADDLYDSIEVISWNASKTTFYVKETYGDYIQNGHYIVSEIKDESGVSHYKLTKIISKVKKYNQELNGWSYEYKVNLSVRIEEIKGLYYVTRYYPIDSFIKYYQLYTLDGFKLTDYHLPGGVNKASQLEKILGMLDPANSNLVEVLKEKEQITFRYLVDTFDGSINPMMGPKVWLSYLAKERGKCLALLNAPSMKEFTESNDPRFTEEKTRENPKPILNTRYIAEGGNLTLGPTKIFSLPDENNGSKYTGVFAPFLKLYENGKQIDVPPAAYVSNLFVDKFLKGTPYAIVAGPRRGVISEPKLVGLEYEFLQKDRDNLEPMGINPIIKKKNIGYMIYGNQMAYQKTSSAFNNLHVRDLLITIEDAIETILGNYIFEFNDSTTRLEIKTTVESYLDGVRSSGGIYNYVVIMDESNNTNEIIDMNVAVLDVIVEPARGIHKFIARITVAKTGGASAGGFTFV